MKKDRLELIYKILFLIALIAFWEILGRHDLYNSKLLPYPSQLLHSAAEIFKRREFYEDVLGSLHRVFIGFLIAAFAGFFIALLFSLVRPIRPFLELLLELLRPIPPLAWIPIAVLWFGIGNKPAYFIVFLASFFPIFVNVLAGLTSVDPLLVTMAHSFRMDEKAIFFKVRVPTILPYLFAGLKAGLGVGWMAVVTSEMMGAYNGLGYRIQQSRVMLDIENVVISMIVIGVLGFTLSILLTKIETMLMPWRHPK